MKYLFFPLIVCCFACTSPSSSTSTDANATFDIQRGTNISHWLSQSDQRGEARKQYFSAEDVAYIADLGFDHIRIPIDEEQMWTADGKKEAEAFSLLHQALQWCQDHGLKAIVDLHILRSHHFNEAEKPLWTDPQAQASFYQCWRDLSAELQHYPIDFLAYELMNEPVADDPEDWNRLVAEAVAIVRQEEPNRKILVGSNMWQSTETFDVLRLPDQDSNLIVSFHFYQPFLITHYQTSWTPIGVYEGPVQYPGTPLPEGVMDTLRPAIKPLMSSLNKRYTKDSLEALILKPVRFAKARGLQVYCGEWGCYPAVPRPAMLNWYSDVRSILETHGVAWTTWDYKGGFGIRDSESGETVEDLRAVLLD